MLIIRRSNFITQCLVSSHTVGGRPVSGASDCHLQCVMILDVVYYNFDLLMMSTIVLETCRGI